MAETSPRRILLSAQITDHAQYLSGIPSSRFYLDPQAMVEVQLAVSEYYGFGGAAHLRPSISYDLYNVEAEALGQRLVYHDTGMPDIDQTDPLVKTADDLAKVRTLDPAADGRLPAIIQFYRYLRERTGSVPAVRFCGPFSLAVLIRGYANLVRDMRRDPPFAHALLSAVTDRVLVPYIELLQGESGSSVMPIGADAWASPPNTNLPILESFVMPYLLRLRERFGRISCRAWWGESVLKDPCRLLEMKLAVNGDYLYGYDPDVEKLGPDLWVEFARERGASLSLGVDAQLLGEGPVEAIVERVRRYALAGLPVERFSLHLNNVPVETPSAHLHAAVAAVNAYGPCRRPEDFDDVRVVVPDREPFADFAARRGVPAR